MSNSNLETEELEIPCKACGGEGGHYTEHPRYWRWCGLCNGAGFVPTEFGTKVLALMQHNFRPLFERMQNGDD
jgi:hypothetical protein